MWHLIKNFKKYKNQVYYFVYYHQPVVIVDFDKSEIPDIIATKMVHNEMKYKILHYFATCRCQ